MITAAEQQIEHAGFSIEYTKDGSPTLRLPDQGESMHHSGGAAAETRYIYAEPINEVHRLLAFKCKTCIVGLGLGYIEIAWALSLLNKQIQPNTKLTFHSFEIVDDLKTHFLHWLNSDQKSIYDLVVEKMTDRFSISEVKAVLNLALHCGSSLESDFSQGQLLPIKWNVICYDAFSQKTNEQLWQSEFLDLFLKNNTATDCLLTTYACTGVLRKTLNENDFTFIKRPGFLGKRDSSLAYRGILKDEFDPLGSGQTF